MGGGDKRGLSRLFEHHELKTNSEALCSSTLWIGLHDWVVFSQKLIERAHERSTSFIRMTRGAQKIETWSVSVLWVQTRYHFGSYRADITSRQWYNLRIRCLKLSSKLVAVRYRVAIWFVLGSSFGNPAKLILPDWAMLSQNINRCLRSVWKGLKSSMSSL
jgi:hypothetical protein